MEIFQDLDSNQSQKCEQAKKALVDMLNQVPAKDTGLVHDMMDYFIRTGSLRILEVLVRAQTPHANTILDRLLEWLKTPEHRHQALTLFGFVVRKHPTWLYKIEKHKLIRDILKLLQSEKEIVLLMSALLCIVTLLPIIPMIVSTFLTDLFEVFGHLASINCQNSDRVSEEKMVHLQLGLQMLFHRLYGMYPCNFLSYLSEFAKKDKDAIFEHTIKPLLETVRVHPMLVTATPENEINVERWKYKEPHDVVVECAKLSVADQDLHMEYVRCQNTLSTELNRLQCDRTPFSYSGIASPFQSLTDREQLTELKRGDPIWSPYTEIVSATSTIPHTPTPSFGVPLASGSTSGPLGAIMGVSGSSPPEAAVEATPETTPMKELNMKPSTNPHAVCAIFTTSQPASPMRRDPHSLFTFLESPGSTKNHQHPLTLEQTTINKIPTKLYDQKMQQMLNDRQQMRFQVYEKKTELSPLTSTSDICLINSSNNGTPSFDPLAVSQEDEEVRDLTSNVAACIETATVAAEDIAKRYEETERAAVGGQVSSSNRSLRVVARRNRFTTYCHNDSIWKNVHLNDEINGYPEVDRVKVRRTQSCPTILGNKLGILGTGAYRKQVTSRVTQTLDTWPKLYECTLFDLLDENNKLRNMCNVRQPQELLNQYIDQSVKLKEPGNRLDQDHFQLLCLQLQYEQYRREIHAERNRRLMGRSRDVRCLESEQDRLKEKIKDYDKENQRLELQIESTRKLAINNEQKHLDKLKCVEERYEEELKHRKILQATNETLQSRLNEEIQKRVELTVELDMLRGQIFDMRNELQHAQMQAEMGHQCKQELVRLESEFLVMGEVHIKLRDRLAEVDNLRAREEEINHLQESYNVEIKDLKRALEEKVSQFESTKHKLGELQTQIVNNEKAVIDQKRLLKTVRDEYEEKFKALNTKYEVQKTVILQMEKELLNLYRNHTPVSSLAPCSPDTDRTDIASSIERNSPLSTSLASNDSLPASLRSVTEIRNLQPFAEPSNIASGSSAATNIPLNYYPYSQHYHSNVAEAKAASSGEEAAATSSTHTLDIKVPVTSTNLSYRHQQQQHQHQQQQQQQQKQKKQKQTSIPQNPGNTRTFLGTE